MRTLHSCLLALGIAFTGQTLFAQHLTYEQKKHFANQKQSFWEDKTKTGDVSKPQTNEAVTLEMLNCPPGVYKTYEDFVNRKPENLTPTVFNCKGGGFKGYIGGEMVFKDASGKKVTLSCDEFWGWKEKDGILWRNAVFTTAKGSFAVPFYVEYVSDYIEYHPTWMVSNYEFRPFEWCSADLKSPLQVSEYYTRQNKTRYAKVSAYQNGCDAKAPRGINQWIAQCESCETQCPDIRFIYVRTKGGIPEQGIYKKGGME